MLPTAAVFDFDGTLVDSSDMWRQVMKSYLMRYATGDLAAYLDKIEHLSFSEKCRLFNAELMVGSNPQEVFDEISVLVAEGYLHDVSSLPHAFEYIRALHAAGIRLGIASSTPRSLIAGALERFNALSCFDVITYTGDVGLDKRHPDVYLAAIRTLEASPQNAVVFEDAPFGCRACHEAGICIVGVTYKKNPQEARTIEGCADKTILGYPDGSRLKETLFPWFS